MTEEMKSFAEHLAKKVKTHSEWLTIVKFGRGQLLQDQRFFFQLITTEAIRMKNSDSFEANISLILQELDLKLTLAR